VIDVDSIHDQFGRSVSFSLLLHLVIVLFIWIAAPMISVLAQRFGVAPTEPEMQVVRFRFNEITADVSESSRVEEAPDSDILGRFNSLARDMVRDDKDTNVPAGGRIGFDNSIPGTGAEEDAPGADGDDNGPTPGDAERQARTLLDAIQAVQPGLRDRLPATVEQMMTGKREKPQRPGYGARRSEDFADAGALSFGEYAFSTRAWDYEPYWHSMRRKLLAAWYPPAAYAQYGIIDGGWTLVRAVIEPNGTLSNVEIVESRGHESLHRASQAAMEGAAPFRALPADFPEKNLVVTVRFIYLPPGARDVP
jgi:TonB family protein